MLSSYSDNSTILIYCFRFVTFCQYLSLCAVADINIEMVLRAVVLFQEHLSPGSWN